MKTLPLYARIIGTYEENDLQVKDSVIYINGEVADIYTFKMNYYWMMGDNRHSSADSRYWGFVPEDHVVGKAYFIWLSLDKDKSSFDKIRWKRMFRFIHWRKENEWNSNNRSNFFAHMKLEFIDCYCFLLSQLQWEKLVLFQKENRQEKECKVN